MGKTGKISKYYKTVKDKLNELLLQPETKAATGKARGMSKSKCSVDKRMKGKSSSKKSATDDDLGSFLSHWYMPSFAPR